jgi:class 3 adenylate cyclase
MTTTLPLSRTGPSFPTSGSVAYRCEGGEHELKGVPDPVAARSRPGKDASVDIPQTKYARSGDVMVAYQVTGDGNGVDLVSAPGTASHLAMDWEFPPWIAVIEGMSRFSRLIRFDKRGTGLSDRPTNAATLEERTDDIRAVMDAAGSDRAFILGNSEGANMACLFAATYPERTLGLLIWGGQARWVTADDYPWGLPPDEYEAMITDLGEHGVTDEYLFGPGVGRPEGNDAERELDRRYWQSAASPAAYAALERMNMSIDTRDILPSIRVPTLVMNRTGDPVADVDAARDLAARIPEARFIEFPGNSHAMEEGDFDSILGEVEEFLTGDRHVPESDRVLLTVLFTDIVGSTAKAAEIGDTTWKGLLKHHHEHVRRQLTAHRGVERDTAGDGFFATFDGPARAVRCALAIGAAVRELGVEIRAGVHTGEVELTDDGVQGIAVHIGARVGALAGPSEVFVSQTVKDLVAGSGLTFEDAGEHELKGVPDRWHLHLVRPKQP